uniref:SRS domain-containing protein n=1 Tax=Neospora caninum (strain Liverpool) TaxID=572307 RepID=F0JB51_NEOCL|nr:SRS domain-containing protein [Neospora caninum Liverpool]CEL71318.1 TPA: SRS domain-containing protein [Neospora caninum Liverpool]
MARTRGAPMDMRKAGTLVLVFTLLVSSTELVSHAQETEANTCKTDIDSNAIAVAVDTRTKTVNFVCESKIKNVKPSQEGGGRITMYCTDSTLGTEKNLEDLFGPGSQATVTPTAGDPPGNSEVTLTLGKLPETTQTIYFGCTATAASPGAGAVPGGAASSSVVGTHASSSAETLSGGGAEQVGLVAGIRSRRLMAVASAPYEAVRRSKEVSIGGDSDGPNAQCVVTVTVPADPKANSKPQRHYTRCLDYVGTPRSAREQNMDLEITSENKSVSFQCDTNISTLNPKESTTTIFDGSCEKPVPLAEKLPSAKLEREGSRYTFSVGELPETAITLCYKCSSPADDKEELSPEQKNEACTVKINVAAADLDSDSAASVSTGSVPAVVFAFVVSICFSMVFV